MEQHSPVIVKLVRDRRYRAVATCTVCKATLSVGPDAAQEHLASYALGISMGTELLEQPRPRSSQGALFHLGPGCPGGPVQITVEELLW